MSWYNSLRDLEGDLKKGAVGAGHVAGSIASNPFVDVGIGALFGPEAAAAAGGLGHLLAPGGNIGKGLVGGAEGAALGYGGQALGGMLGGGASGASGAAGTAGQSAASAIPNSALGLSDSPVQQGVLQRVLGGAGNFIKNNRSTLETVGSGAQGVMSAVGQNRQANIEQQRANADAAQIQAAIDKQKAIAAAFGQMYGRGLPSPGQPALPSAPGANGGAPRNAMAPGVRANGLGGVSEPGEPADPNDPTAIQPNPDPPQSGGTAPSTGAKLSILARLGYLPPPSSPYAGNDSIYGTPFGSGYAQASSMGY